MGCQSLARGNCDVCTSLSATSRVPKAATIVGSSNPEAVRKIVVYVDSGWGRSNAKSWSSTQATVATSSGEAVQCTRTRSCRGIGFTGCVGRARLGWEKPIEAMIDSAAALSLGCWRGLGMQRHIQVKLLWVKEAVRHRQFRIIKILGTTNLADSRSTTFGLG